MTQNKAYNVRLLCDLRGIPIESDEGRELYKKSVVDLLIDIRNAREEQQQLQTHVMGDVNPEDEIKLWCSTSRFFTN